MKSFLRFLMYGICAAYSIQANLSAMWTSAQDLHDVSQKQTVVKHRIRPRHSPQTYSAPVDFLGNACRDIFEMYMHLVSTEFIRIMAIAFPPYVALRMADDDIHRHFYDAKRHHNKCNSTFFNHDAAKNIIALPIISLASLAVFSHDEDLRATSWMFVLGMPFVILTKDLIKKIRFRAAYRPYNGNFEKKHVCGGFPSGHMGEMAFMTVLYGARHGLKFAIPLSILSAYVGITFVMCNRHYASQLAAGTAFGALFAIAASRVVDEKMDAKRFKQLDAGIDLTSMGEPALGITYRF